MANSYYQTTVRHKGLNKFKIVKASTRSELNQKVSMIEAQWNEQWKRKCEVERKRIEREVKQRTTENSLAHAELLTKKAEEAFIKINELKTHLIIPKPINRKLLQDFSEYPEKKPTKPWLKEIPLEPHREDAVYNMDMPFLAHFSKKQKNAYELKNNIQFQNDWNSWNENKRRIDDENAKLLEEFQTKCYVWENNKKQYEEEQKAANDEIEYLFENFEKGNKDSIEFYYSYGLEQLPIPIEYTKRVEIEYNPDTKILLVDMLLPSKKNLPTLKKVTFIKSRNEYKEQHQSESFMKSTYDKAIYDIVLVSLNYIFRLDKGDYIEAVTLNGMVDMIDEATGNQICPYILSVNVSKSNFLELNLELVDSKAWFKSIKGVSAATFATVTPVPPIMKMNKEDSRFITGYDVLENIDDNLNLAAIDWQDFENLIRELFAEEFNSSGGEVKITQASRDGGVDAIAFDPDPIRGGKIVIQAKRYTNVVGVSAVRDLYGTVMNEGATKGILVTTSNYGNDAYEFASGKPLTLLNGANLLSLLEKHGHKAKIDLKEAKELLNK